MDKKDLLKRSKVIFDKLSQIPAIIDAKNIMCFVSFGSEVETHSLIKEWITQGKNISVPCIENNKGQKLMHAVKINDFSDLRTHGSFGILEPELKYSDILDPMELDTVIVPGSAFDISKNRMGYGAGFYDRFLIKTSDTCKKIGICYDFQVLNHIPHETYDIPLDLLVTEERIIY